MNGNIIDFRKARADRAQPLMSYFVRIDQYDNGVAGCILDLGDDLDADTLRLVSEQLFTMARFVMDQAHQVGGADGDFCLCTQISFKDGRTRTWTSDEVSSPGQFDWLKECHVDGIADQQAQYAVESA